VVPTPCIGPQNGAGAERAGTVRFLLQGGCGKTGQVLLWAATMVQHPECSCGVREVEGSALVLPGEEEPKG